MEIFVGVTTRSLAFISCRSFCLLGVTILILSAIATVWEFLSPKVVVGLGHRVEYYCWSITLITVL